MPMRDDCCWYVDNDDGDDGIILFSMCNEICNYNTKFMHDLLNHDTHNRQF